MSSSKMNNGKSDCHQISGSEGSELDHFQEKKQVTGQEVDDTTHVAGSNDRRILEGY